MSAPEMSAGRSLGGLAALSAYRAERAEARLRLREALRADRAALRAARAAPPPWASAPDAGALPGPPAEEPSVFAELVERAADEAVVEALVAEEAAAEDTEAVRIAAEELAGEEIAGDQADAQRDVAQDAAEDDAPREDASAPGAVMEASAACDTALVEDATAAETAAETAGETAGEAEVPRADEPPEADVMAAEPTSEPPEDRIAAAPQDDAAPATEAPAAAVHETGARELSAIGELGPGMQLRLMQLGIRTLDELAEADPLALREGLGAISRLLRVERWIETARTLRASA